MYYYDIQYSTADQSIPWADPAHSFGFQRLRTAERSLHMTAIEGMIVLAEISGELDLSRKPGGGRSAQMAENGLWSGGITQNSHALILEKGVFTWTDPVCIARSLKNSADASNARKGTPFRSAMSMLVFYINRAGKKLRQGSSWCSKPQKTSLESCMEKAAHTNSCITHEVY